MQRHPGFTLIELMITVTIIGLLLYVGATSLRTNEIETTRDSAMDIVDLFRLARYVAANQSSAVVVTTLPYGTSVTGGTTRGYADARLATSDICPDESTVASLPVIEEVDFGLIGDGHDDESAGLAVVDPAELVAQRFCVRPNGRVVSNATRAPIRPAGEVTDDDFAGKASLWIQYDPIRMEGTVLAVPRIEVEIPFNGLVRIPQ